MAASLDMEPIARELGAERVGKVSAGGGMLLIVCEHVSGPFFHCAISVCAHCWSASLSRGSGSPR